MLFELFNAYVEIRTKSIYTFFRERKLMVNITQFSNKTFQEAKEFVPAYPDTGEEMTGVKIWVKSSKSDVALPIMTEVGNKLAAQQAQYQRTGKLSIDPSKSVKDEIRLACAVISDFEGFTDDKGKPLESSPEVIENLMTNHDWLRQQVLEKAHDITFFYKSE